MSRQGSILMVIWSYLLLGTTSPASIDSVLAPVEGPASVAVSNEPAHNAAHDDTSVGDRAAKRPLVEAGVDSLDLLAELERLVTERVQPTGRVRLSPVSALPALPRAATLPPIELIDCPTRLTSSTLLLRFRIGGMDNPSIPHVSTFRAQVLGQVWFPARVLQPGDVLDAGDVVSREVDLLREPKAVPADTNTLGRYEVARGASPDRPLVWTDISPRTLVRRGQLVDVFANEGAISVTMKGQATRNGSLGEFVTIRNLESKREFSAEVIDENKVRVHF